MNESSIEESVPQPISSQTEGGVPKLWNPEAAAAWSLIFSPVFGSILVLMNWQALGVKEKIRNAQVWLTISIVVLVVALFLPGTVRSVVSITYLAFWWLAAAQAQTQYIRERWGKTYPRRSWLWPLLIAFGILFGFLCLIFLIAGLASQQ